MNISIRIPSLFYSESISIFFNKNLILIVFVLSTLEAYFATLYYWKHNLLLAYGDAESHINIAKKVVDALTPGFAQLGGIWLPLPHLLMVPFVFSDFLWRTGLAGAIVSGTAFIISCIFLYKTVYILTQNKWASFITFLIFALNPNVMYMQATPMTELPLIAFFVLSTYYFIKYLESQSGLPYLIISAFFCFCATLTRYDAWFLTLFEGLIIIFLAIREKNKRQKRLGEFFIFATFASFGIFLWLLWGFLILGTPFYFMTSEYSAHAQQLAWLAKNELPSYHNIISSFMYYSVTAISNVGVIISALSLIGIAFFLQDQKIKNKLFILLVLFVPFIFNVASLYLGQDVIFIPYLTPSWYEWHLFNVRYGMLMIAVSAVFYGYLFFRSDRFIKFLLVFFIALQTSLYILNFIPVISLQDGTQGLSAAKVPTDVENFINTHYTGGLVLLDDYARTISITRSTIPMQDIIYVGTKPYWGESLKHPEKYATWVIMQKNDAVWTSIYDNTAVRGDLYKYFNKVYTSNQILIFKRM